MRRQRSQEKSPSTLKICSLAFCCLGTKPHNHMLKHIGKKLNMHMHSHEQSCTHQGCRILTKMTYLVLIMQLRHECQHTSAAFYTSFILQRNKSSTVSLKKQDLYQMPVYSQARTCPINMCCPNPLLPDTVHTVVCLARAATNDYFQC